MICIFSRFRGLSFFINVLFPLKVLGDIAEIDLLDSDFHITWREKVNTRSEKMIEDLVMIIKF